VGVVLFGLVVAAGGISGVPVALILTAPAFIPLVAKLLAIR